MVRICIAFAAAVCAATGCASTPDKTAEVYQGKQYRTGSNIPVHDGDLPSEALVVKPDTVPIFKGPGPKVGPTGAGGG
jgi:hypothetical protein